MLRNTKIGHRLWGGFTIMLLITLAIGALAVKSLNNLSTLTADMYSHPLVVSNAVRDVKANIIAIRSSMVSAGLATNNQELEREISDIHNLESHIFDQLSLIKERFLGSQAQVDKTIELVRAWRSLRDEEISLARAKKQAELINIIKGRGAQQVAEINLNMDKLLAFANNKAAEFLENSKTQRSKTVNFLLFLLTALFFSGVLISAYITRSITGPLNRIKGTTAAIAGGDLDTNIGEVTRDEIGELASSIKNMQTSLRQSHKEQAILDWRKDGLARINNLITGNPKVETLTSSILSEICHRLDASIGTIYILHDDNEPAVLRLTAGFGYNPDSEIKHEFRVGDGLVGQVAQELQPILISDLPSDYIKVSSGLGEYPPTQLAIFPCFHKDKLMAVIEIGVFDPLKDIEFSYLEEVLLVIGVAIEAAENREQLEVALHTANRLTEEAQAQQEEVESLNDELEEQNRLLHNEKHKVEVAQQELKARADELSMSSRYKSEFLANMSHELRTPLNSLLLLSRGLADNKDGSLSNEQVQSASIIYQSGHDLLDLINEILDLSKIEAGRMELNIETMRIQDLAGSVKTNFEHMTSEKGIYLDVGVDTEAPENIRTDRKRLEQIVKNLVSNAIKFTEKGGVKVTFTLPSNTDNHVIAINVIDTGVGIAKDQQAHIFEAFQQADGSTSRKFGGTGLGLSISRELANLLGGEITLESEPNEGSIFTVLLPLQAPSIEKIEELYPNLQVEARKARQDQKSKTTEIADDRKNIQSGDRVLLIVEDNLSFIDILMQNSRSHGFKCITATTGEDALDLALEYKPSAILLDLVLPDTSGWQVLDSIKQNTETRHIPVHIISIMDPDPKAMHKGAVGYLQKPVSPEDLNSVLTRLERVVSAKTRKLLVVEDDKASRIAISQLIGNGIVEIDEAATGAEAIAAIKNNQYDCIILDLGLPDMDGYDLLSKIEQDSDVDIPPVIIYTGRELDRNDELRLRDYSDTIIIKDVRSEERLLDEVSLFLHRVVSDLPDNKRQQIERLYRSEEILKNKKILVVDDDMRTLFAVTRILSEYGIEAIKAEDGERALDLIQEHPDLDLILMDIMMPGLDGYQTMERIRQQDRFKSIPIIVLTAKAMPEDQKRCLDAGANDYMTKPIDEASLVSLIKVWLYR